MVGPTLLQTIEKTFIGRLKGYGYKQSRGMAVKDLNKEARVLIGLTGSTFSSGVVAVFPVLSMSFKSIYEVGMQLGAYPEAKAKTKISFAQPLKYLLPREGAADYEFRRDCDNEDVYSRLMEDVAGHALPTFESLASVNEALKALESGRISEPTGWETFLPLAHAVLGETIVAVQIARQFLDRIGSTRGSGPRYAKFVESLEDFAELSRSSRS